MRTLTFSVRTAKEILRDPLSIVFGAGFPVILLLLMTLIQRSIPVPLFEPQRLTPGIAVFALSFLCLFTATLVSKDRSGSFLLRLRTTPMTAIDFTLGYILPMLPIALLQLLITYAAALILGLQLSARIMPALLSALPLGIFQISLGLICGCCLRERQVGGLCGALLTNLSAWLSGAWFDVELVGGAFETIAKALPFANAVACGRSVLQGSWDGKAFIIVCVYAVVAFVISAFIAKKCLT